MIMPAAPPGRDPPARHVAIVAPPTPGHYDPLAAVATELVALGHRVTFVHVEGADRYLQPDDGFASIGGAGVLDRYLVRLARPTGMVGLNRMIAATASITALLLDSLPATLARIGADAVVADSAEPAGGLVARHLGLPYVTSVTGLPLLREPEMPPPFVGWSYRRGAVARFRNSGGHAVTDLLLTPIRRAVTRRAEAWALPDDGGLSPLLAVAQCPAALDFPRERLPAQFRYGAPWRRAVAAMASPKTDARPLVFCSLGTLQGARRGLFTTMTRACASIGARAVVAHGGGLSDAEAAMLPGDPLVAAFWPQTAILPHCAAAILHGGFNTVLDSLAAGVPIVALPIAFEQPATAARIVHVGAGVSLRWQGLDHATLARAIEKVMNAPAYAAAARRIGEDMRRSGDARSTAAAISAAIAP